MKIRVKDNENQRYKENQDFPVHGEIRLANFLCPRNAKRFLGFQKISKRFSLDFQAFHSKNEKQNNRQH